MCLSIPPPRCSSRRIMKNWEDLKYRLLGPVCGFDPDGELQCNRYQGHDQYKGQELHEDVCGNMWSGK